MKVLITGGAGYIGTELAYKLASDSNISSITIYDNLSRGNYNLFLGNRHFPEGKVTFLRAELLDSRGLRDAVAQSDVVYHLAAKVTTPFADTQSHLFEQVNHWGTAEVIYAAEETDLKQLIYLSSVSVYGSTEKEAKVKSTPNPSTFYGVSKLRGEAHVQRYLDKHPGHIIRCGNVYGYSKSMRFDALINRFLFEANFNGRVTIHGSGEQTRSFIHINKVVEVLSKLIDQPQSDPIYNLVEHVLSVNEVADKCADHFEGLERIFVNQHMEMRELKAAPSPELNELFDASQSLDDEIEEFKKKFSF